MKNTSKIIRLLPPLVIIFSFFLGLILYPEMPQIVSSHWNASGVANGYSSKTQGLFFLPFISLVIYLLLLVLPKLDPLKENIQKFRIYYDSFILAFVVFFFYIHLLTILWNLGLQFNMNSALSPALGLLFYTIGLVLEKAKRNWFIGIRTPWTLSSDKVWDKTHELGGKLFKLSGILCLVGIFFPTLGIFLVIFTAISAGLISTIYSYFLYKKFLK